LRRFTRVRVKRKKEGDFKRTLQTAEKSKERSRRTSVSMEKKKKKKRGKNEEVNQHSKKKIKGPAFVIRTRSGGWEKEAQMAPLAGKEEKRRCSTIKVGKPDSALQETEN